MSTTRAGETQEVLAHALRPLAAVGEDVHARTVTHVLDGTAPQVLEALGAEADTRELFADPGSTSSFPQVGPAARDRLHAVGVGAPDRLNDPHEPMAAPVRAHRLVLYRNGALTSQQWQRYGQVLLALGGRPNRLAAGVPPWLCALVNDVATVEGSGWWSSLVPAQWRAAPRNLDRWSPAAMAELLENVGTPEAEIPGTIMLTWLADAPGIRRWADTPLRVLDGIEDYLADHGTHVPATGLTALSARARTELAHRLGRAPAAAAGCAHLLAALVVDRAATVRRAAVEALAALEPERACASLAPELAVVGAGRATEAVTWLATTDAGAVTLREAARRNPAVATTLASVAERADLVADKEPVEPVALPPFAAVPEVSAAPARSEIARALSRQLELFPPGDRTVPYLTTGASQVTPNDVEATIAIADGRQPASDAAGEATGKDTTQVRTVLSHMPSWWVAQHAPSLTLVHLARLVPETGVDLTGIVRHRADASTDPRAIAEALRRAGKEPDEAVARWVLTCSSPEVAWPWAMENPATMSSWLASTRSAGPVMEILSHCPVLPAEVLDDLARVAVGTSTVNRRVAQRLLRRHPHARDLAVQALDGGAASRVAAAQWLALLADPGAVPALRHAVASERSHGARAAILRALESCGDDLADLLDPQTLAAEAAKGLRAKAPASLSWFDWEGLPSVRWADGAPVDPRVVRWWVILADKLKDPDGQGLIDLYLSRLDPLDAAALGEHVLRAWITQDTLHPDPQDSRVVARTEAPGLHQRAQKHLARVRAEHPEDLDWIASAEQEAARSVEDHAARVFARHQKEFLTSAIADKGLLALTVRMDARALVERVADYEKTGKRPQGEHRAQLVALYTALAAHDDPAALHAVVSAAQRHPMRSVQAAAVALVGQVAERHGWSPEELADRTVPTAGFSDDGLLHLPYGPQEITGRLTPELRIVLTDASGRTLSSLPDRRADQDWEEAVTAKKTLAAARKAATAVRKVQPGRLYEAMCASRRWTVEDWRSLLVGHPLVSRLVTRLIWLAVPAGSRTADRDGTAGTGRTARAFRPTEDGVLLDADDAAVDLEPGTEVMIAHGTLLAPGQAEAWRTHLADYEVEPLFDQLSAPASACPTEATAATDLAGRRTTTFALRRTAARRGYRRGAAQDGGWFLEYTKAFPSLGLTAALTFTGAELPEVNRPCAIRALELRRGERLVRLDQVPAVLLAECYADYAAVAALGPYDPTWREAFNL